MSEGASLQYALEAQRRREQMLAHARETTMRYHARLASLCDSLEREGLAVYVPHEVERARAALAGVLALAEASPEAARDKVIQLANDLPRLRALAVDALRAFEVREAKRRRQLEEDRQRARGELSKHLIELMAAIRDPVERDFAFDGLRQLQADYSDRAVEPGDLAAEVAALEQRVEATRVAAREKAEAWKRERGPSQAAVEATLDVHREVLEKDKTQAPGAVVAALESIAALRDQATAGSASGGGLDRGALDSGIAAALRRADDGVVDERCRRETVRAVLETLKGAGFVPIGGPRLQREGDRDEVVILARKPSGAEAEFRITSTGGFAYRFERYEGTACKKDIAAILPVLQEIYGVELSNKRVSWQNPDRLSASARPLEDGRSEGQHGR